jgi:type I restriction enzyme S subunit
MKLVPLTSICKPKQWKTISTKELKEDGFPVYGANGKIGFYGSYTHEHPTVLITCRGATCGTINISEPKSYVNGNAMALDNLSEEVNLYYIAHYLRFRKLDDVISGSAQPQITGQGLSNLQIPLPPLEQQKKIAAILDASDAYTQKTKALIAKYDELTQSLFLNMFGDPVKNEKGWEKKEFKEYILEVKNGITRRPKSEEDNSGDKVLKLKHIRSNYINYDCENRIMLEESEKQKFVVEIGDLLFIRVNGNPDYVGRCALHNDINQEVYYNDHIMRVRYNFNYYNGLFLSQYLNYPYGQSEISKQIKTSAGQHTINQGGLEKLNLIIPPIQLQNKFAERVQAIEVQKAQAQVSLEKAEELFNSLLQRAFKGELV